MRFLALSFIPTAGLAAFVLSWLLIFRRERKHVWRLGVISDAMPDTPAFCMQCFSEKEFGGMGRDVFMARAAGDPYFRYVLLRTAERVVACGAAVERLPDAEGSGPFAWRADERGRRLVSDRTGALDEIMVYCTYRDPDRIFARRLDVSLQVPFVDALRAIGAGEPSVYNLYTAERFLELAERYAHPFRDLPGAWCVMACDAFVPQESVMAVSDGPLVRSGERMWHDGRKDVRRELRRVRKRAGVTVYIRMEPSLPWERPEETEERLWSALDSLPSNRSGDD